MKTNAMLLALGLVSVLGLNSCTAERSDSTQSANPTSAPSVQPTAAPISSEDNWKLEEPLIHTKRGDQLTARGFLAAAMDPIDADARVEFPLKDGASFKGVSIEIDSVCQTPSGELSSVTVLKEVHEFPLVSILPESILLGVNVKDAERVACNLRFKASNAIGSTHSFNVPQVRLSHVETLQAISVVSVTPSQVSGPDLLAAQFPKLFSAQAPSYRLNPVPESHSQRNVDLICDHFRNHRRFSSDQDIDASLGQLINGTIEGFDPAKTPYDPRSSFILQTCHLLIRTSLGESGITDAKITRDFQLAFPTATITGQLNFDGSNHDPLSIVRLSQNPFVVIHIDNPSLSPVAFRFQLPGRQTLYLQPVTLTQTNRAGHLGQTFAMPTNYSLTGSSRQWQDGQDLVFEVGPLAQANISMQIAADWRCYSGDGFLAAFGYGFVGFNYRFVAPMPLLQLQKWDPVAVRMDSPVLDLSPFAVPLDVAAGGVLSGWAPSQDWKKVSPDNCGRPQLSEGPTPLDGRMCQVGPISILQ